ncbi:MAG: hypothetical protein KBD24_02670 [Candidatus Pacebacteria bacterium]|nr:hypothetical protein [Candidatus Paceibacterota bacterium]
MRKPPLQDVIIMRPSERSRSPQSTPHDFSGEHATSVSPRRFGEEMGKRTVTPERDDVLYGSHNIPPQHTRTEYDEFDRQRAPQGRTGRDRRWLFLALGIGAVMVLSAVSLSFLFAGATVTVYPKQDTIVVNATFTAREDGAGGALQFKRMDIERTAVQNIPALAEKEVEERAQGVITVYNEYSDTPQRLIKNTRFATADGKIYRIRESIEVPGKKSDGTPGNIDVTVYAEEPGDTYNRGPSDFIVPGFVGKPQEKKVYGKSKEGITGGFAGVRRIVDEKDRLAALEKLESQLRDELLAEIEKSTDKPSGYRSFGGAVFFEFNALPDEVVETDQVRLSLSGKLHTLLFSEDLLAQRIATLTIGSYEGSPIRIDNMQDLDVSIKELWGDKEQPSAPWNAGTYNVTVAGKAVFIWQVDKDAFARDLVNKDKAVLQAPVKGGILEAYPGIDRVQARVRPFWKNTFPQDQADIAVTIKRDS